MPLRKLVFILAATGLAGAAWAEPTKAPPKDAGQPAKTKPRVVIASAEIVASTAVAETQPSEPAKRVRTARVSSCRCGNQAPAED